MTAQDIINTGVSAGYNVDIARKYGLVEAIVLNKLIFLHQFSKREDGFTWYTSKDWEKHTSLSDYQVRRALNHLRDEGLIEVKNTYIQGTTIKARHHRFIFSESEALETSTPIGSLETKESEALETSTPIGSLETKESVYNNANNNANNKLGKKEFFPENENRAGKKHDDEIDRLYYQAIKALSLPVTNHNVLRSKIAEMKKTYQENVCIDYLTFMRDNYLSWQTRYKPQVNNALDIYAKSMQIMRRLNDGSQQQEVF